MIKKELRTKIWNIFPSCCTNDIETDEKIAIIIIRNWSNEVYLNFNNVIKLMSLLKIKVDDNGLINSDDLIIHSKCLSDREGNFIVTKITCKHNLEFEKEDWEE